MDPISNMLISIKNALMVKKEACFVPTSKITFEIARILKDKKFIEDFSKETQTNKTNRLKLILKYINKHPAITKIKRISHLGRRIYMGYDDLRVPKFGILILSTSQGIMTSGEAKKRRLGGEMLCEIR